MGQIANDAGKGLTSLGEGKIFCLAGIGGHISNILESTKAAKKIVAIDGCPVDCTKKTLEHAGFKPDVHVVVTELGIEKKYEFLMDVEDIDKVIDKVVSQL